VFVLRRKEPDAPRPFRVPGYPLTPALFIAASMGIVLNAVVTTPARALVGLTIVATGVPAYFVWRGRSVAGRTALGTDRTTIQEDI
jgi:APA family basic amino acid/polyamine antiporter